MALEPEVVASEGGTRKQSPRGIGRTLGMAWGELTDAPCATRASS